jgi:hypothetical protein
LKLRFGAYVQKCSAYMSLSRKYFKYIRLKYTCEILGAYMVNVNYESLPSYRVIEFWAEVYCLIIQLIP